MVAIAAQVAHTTIDAKTSSAGTHAAAAVGVVQLSS